MNVHNRIFWAIWLIAICLVTPVSCETPWLKVCTQHRPLADCKADWNILKQDR